MRCVDGSLQGKTPAECGRDKSEGSHRLFVGSEEVQATSSHHDAAGVVFFTRIAERMPVMQANPFESQLERLARTLTEQFGVLVTCQGENASTDDRQVPGPARREC